MVVGNKMIKWKISPKQQNTVEEHQLFEKDQQILCKISVFRTGTVVIDGGDSQPDLEQNDKHAVNMYDCGYECELQSLDDQISEYFVWPPHMLPSESIVLQTDWNRDNSLGLETHGWKQYATQCWFAGEVAMTKISE